MQHPAKGHGEIPALSVDVPVGKSVLDDAGGTREAVHRRHILPALQVRRRPAGVRPGVAVGVLQRPDRLVVASQPRRLLPDEQPLRPAGHKGEGDQRCQGQQEDCLDWLAQGGAKKYIFVHTDPFQFIPTGALF